MSYIQQFKLGMLVFANINVFGWIVPALISYNNTALVACGIFIAMLSAYITGIVIRKEFKK